MSTMSLAVPLSAALVVAGVALIVWGLRTRRAPNHVAQALLAYTLPLPAPAEAQAGEGGQRWALRPLLAASWDLAARVPALGSHLDRLEAWLTRHLVRA